ncbi:alpha/beta hydrolase [Rossellomorea marisflavi]|uniref:alpha/beta hydrolase n=1 Tax=Rossellomorea marisflavi TaxID=189381 RepID=UPI00064F2CD8|nr:alpha/beta fold hydrolase [Rossellomorea marisflavi]KMK92616.1 carboxylesterase [Rossellomorea marisflavi]
MKVVAPKPFTYKEGERAVLLLHGFTGSTIDVKGLGRVLRQAGFTCHAPLYTGHGGEAEVLIGTSPEEWWQDAQDGFRYLQEQGYGKIAVAGVSLGGTYALRLAMMHPVSGMISMCAPTRGKSRFDLAARVIDYAERFKTFEGKQEELRKEEMDRLAQRDMSFLDELQSFIDDTGNRLSAIKDPTLILQGAKDASLYKESAFRIHDEILSEEKELKWYGESGHIITLDQERQQVYEDVKDFLLRLDW